MRELEICVFEISWVGSICDNKYLSWVYGVDRKICHEGHWSASRGLPSEAERWSRVTDFSIHTIHPWKIRFLAYLLIYHISFFPSKSFYLSLKKSALPATAVRFFTFTSNLHEVTSFFDVTAVKTNVTWRRIYVTSYTTNALNTRDFYPVLGEITWVR